MRALCIAALITSLSTAATIHRPSKKALHEFRRQAFGAHAVAGAGTSAVVGQLRNRPGEWGTGAGGFAKRFGSAFGQHIVKTGIELPVAAWRHENLNYHPSNLQGTWPRVKYAVKSTFIVPRTNRPGKTVAVSRISGNLGAGVISRAWQPASAAGLGAGLVSGGIGIGAEVGVNVAREFWPRKRHAVAGRTRVAKVEVR